MLSDGAPVAFRCDALELIEQGSDTPLYLRAVRAGVEITPDSATVTVLDASGTAVVTDGEATCADGVAVFIVPGTATAGAQRGEGWLVIWRPVLPGELVPRTFRNAAALVRTRLYPSIDDADIYRRVPALNPSQATGKRTVHGYTTFAPFLDEAWTMVNDRFARHNRRPWLVLSPDALREAHLTLTLALIFADFGTASGTNPVYYERSREFRAEYEAAYAGIRYIDDESDEGKGNTGPRQSATTTVFFGPCNDF